MFPAVSTSWQRLQLRETSECKIGASFAAETSVGPDPADGAHRQHERQGRPAGRDPETRLESLGSASLLGANLWGPRHPVFQLGKSPTKHSLPLRRTLPISLQLPMKSAASGCALNLLIISLPGEHLGPLLKHRANKLCVPFGAARCCMRFSTVPRFVTVEYFWPQIGGERKPVNCQSYIFGARTMAK